MTTAAEGGDCVVAEEAWWRSRMHQPHGTAWVSKHGPETREKLAACWSRRAEGEPERAVQVDQLERARRWDRWSTTLGDVRAPLVEVYLAEGHMAREEQDWESAYAAYSAALRLDPSQAWARRYAEEARALRLGIDSVSKAKAKVEREERQRELRERRQRQAEARSKTKRKSVTVSGSGSGAASGIRAVSGSGEGR